MPLAEQEELEIINTTTDSETQTAGFDPELYKQWFRSRDQAGFLSIKPWWDALKVVVDIGEADPKSNTNKLVSHSEAYLDMVTLATYCRSVVNGHGARDYPQNSKQGVRTPEGLTVYGGSEKTLVSRVFKAQHYPTGKDTFDSTSFRWGIAHYEGTVSRTGAIMPKMDKQISVNTIKITRQNLAEISYRLDVALSAFASDNPRGWYA